MYEKNLVSISVNPSIEAIPQAEFQNINRTSRDQRSNLFTETKWMHML